MYEYTVNRILQQKTPTIEIMRHDADVLENQQYLGVFEEVSEIEHLIDLP